MRHRKKKGLKVPRLGQLGIVVRDVDRTIDYYQGAFGIGPWAVFRGEPDWCFEDGKPVSFTGKIAMAQAGSVQIELIEILEGRSLHSDFLGEQDEGLHHVGFFVTDVAARVQASRDAGIEVLQHGMLKQLGLSIEYAYLDSTGTGGVIMEFIEPRFLGVPFPLRGPLLRLGAKLGGKLSR